MHPNPMVGCVIVRDGAIVGEGWHGQYGGPHAEVMALEAAGDRARGATAYVSLEPCRHVGKTPACTAALVAAGVRRVVFGAADPGHESGGGARELAATGIEVVGPVFSRTEAWRANPAFMHRHEHSGPLVTLKLAVSLDGRIAARRGERTRLTGPEAQLEVHRMRAEHDAVVVGIDTVCTDDPELTVRLGVEHRRAPVRIVMDSRARLAELDLPKLRLSQGLDSAPVWVVCTSAAPEARLERLEQAGIVVHSVAADSHGRVSVEALLELASAAGLSALLVEGGAAVAGSFLSAGQVHRLTVFVAPLLLGADAVAALPAAPPAIVAEGWQPAAAPVIFGRDIMLQYDRNTPPMAGVATGGPEQGN